ncbi:type II secretion system protein N [Phytopseudomonas dryadis]|uniref:Type II secretion system protein GspC N-terminal domain-containing protein n=1 Tax=Phytopseudomonas dryadis TaxID=2487520 RepID=A0ABY1Z1Q3_9GAMM|nr:MULTISPECIES: type II secretion system protein N [Pseudomonas]TBV01912.1 hypothetical protein DNK34_20050 [Pseudomonas dryadis]TBV13869.1 hypothetical protein DNK41_21415 [Pseudomonas sp. FRB 230]
MASLLIKLNRLMESSLFRWTSMPLVMGCLAALLAFKSIALRQTLQLPADANIPLDQPQAASPKPLSAELLTLFGTSRDKEAAQPELAVLPESNLNLQVSAIFFNSSAAQSHVILEDGDKTLSLKPGEEVRPGITLQKVESHRITLKRNGQLEQVSFRGYGDSPADVNLESLPPIAQSMAPPTPTMPNAEQPAMEPNNVPTPYQQYIQRKIAQNK